MKQLFIIACLYFLHISSFGQTVLHTNEKASDASNKTKKIVLDNATLKCYYLFNKKKEGAAKPYRTDTMVLDIGATVSRFHDPARLGRDSLIAFKMKNMRSENIKSISIFKDASAKDLSDMQGTVSSSSNEGESYQIYKDRSASKASVIDYTAAGGDKFQYEDEIGPLPWKISNDTATIGSYTCQKATLHFRGRDYIAWFASNVPVSDGPWKFMGLPGLILKVEDTQQLFSFTLIGLQQLTTPLPILANDTKNIKCTRSEFEKLKKKQGTGIQFNLNGGNVILAEFPGKYDYMPMELE
jgi:GLPGLI family protein